ncbi:hypothetical protein FACS189459_2530 [Bacilli bacterium]|nr:hypothetical protein FACS189459_2530 [Bacilli bacterium]
MITEAWNGPFNDSDPIIKMLGIDSLMNCEGSRVFDVTKEFKMFSTVVLPGVEAGKPITIVGEPEKILDIFLSFA